MNADRLNQSGYTPKPSGHGPLPKPPTGGTGVSKGNLFPHKPGKPEISVRRAINGSYNYKSAGECFEWLENLLRGIRIARQALNGAADEGFRQAARADFEIWKAIYDGEPEETLVLLFGKVRLESYKERVNRI